MQLPWVYLSVWLLIHHKNHSAQNQITNPDEDSTYVVNCVIIINLVTKSFSVNRGRDSFRNAGIFFKLYRVLNKETQRDHRIPE